MSRRGEQTVKEFNATDLDELLNSTLNEVDNDLDMNDPELLKQLQELSSTSTPKKAKNTIIPPKRKQPQNMEIDIDSYASLAQETDDIQVDLDESDFNDPHLLNELSSLSKDLPHESEAQTKTSSVVEELMGMGFTQKQAEKALDMFDNNLERAANYLFDAPANMAEDEDTDMIASSSPNPPTPIKYSYDEPNTHDQDGEEEEESNDPQFWKQKAQEYQQMALTAKKAGDKKKAIALLRESKTYNQKYQDLVEIQPSTLEKEANTNQNTMPISSSRVTTPSPSSTQNREAWSKPLPPSPVTTPSVQSNVSNQQAETTNENWKQAQELLNKVIPLQKQYKEAAIHYKEIGNLAAAKQMVRTSKDLLHTGIKLKSGHIADLSTVKLPESPDMTLGDGKIRQVQEFPSGNQLTSLEQIEQQLEYQINICHNLSIQQSFTTNRRKKTLTDNTQGGSDVYVQLEKALSADLVSVHATKPNIPSLHYEQVNYTYKNVLDTIPDNMMEFKIVRAMSLPTLNIATNLDPFVTWDFGGWPPENTAQASMNKGETPVVSGINPEFDFTMHIPISRTNRLFQRYVQRKKLTVEVFHNKYTYGLFRRPTSLGKVMLPMDRLLTKTSISGVFDLLDSSRKKTGGKIELQVNLREPLMGEDIAKRSERWLVVDAFDGTVSQFLSMAGLTVGGLYVSPTSPSVTAPSTANSSTPSTPVVQTTESSSLSSPKSSEKQQQQQPSGSERPEIQSEPASSTNPDDKMGDSELEAAEEEFNSVDNIVSNMVLEHEMGLVNAGIASKQSAKAKDDLMDRKQALEIKMNMLVIQVQTGILDMDTYLENVQKRMDGDRRLALVFKKYNRLDLAKACLVRKKIMQDELDEAKAAMAEQQEEE